MCDLLATCTEEDDPLAVALLASKRPARLEVVCPVRRHRLAAIYDLGDHGGLAFVHQSTRELLHHVFGLDGLDPRDGASYMHDHAAVVPLAELEARKRRGDLTTVHLRCRCGSFLVDALDCARTAQRGRSNTLRVDALPNRRP